jgi:hypothetical protein
MNSQVALLLTCKSGVDPAVLGKKALAALRALPGVATAALQPEQTSALEGSVAEYSSKLEALSSTLDLIAHDFEPAIAYGASSTRARPERLAAAKDTPATLIARIRRFLVPIPEQTQYAEIQMLKKLVLTNLTTLPATPEGEVSPVLLNAFEQYRSAYTKAYLALLTEREAAIKSWQKSLPALQQQLKAISALDEITELGKPLGRELAARLTELESMYQPLGKTEKELLELLNFDPTIAGVTLFSPSPAAELADYAVLVDLRLGEKLQQIRERSILTILATAKDPSVQKLGKLLQLTKLEEIPKLFTPKTTKKLVSELRKLCQKNPKSSRLPDLGEFRPTLRQVRTPAEIAQLTTEFKAFLQSYQ